MDQKLVVALISDVFCEEDAEVRLLARLAEAKEMGAQLAVIPELACNPWSPATHHTLQSDAEPLGGLRTLLQSRCARAAQIGLVGAVMTTEGGERRNESVVFSSEGEVVARYAKVHLPQEPGFWEQDHYGPGDRPSPIVRSFGLPFALQICSDVNRPVGTHVAVAMGAMAVINPRSTELATYARWRPVFEANARTGCCYVLSVNRPAPEQGVLIGGPSVAFDPHGNVMAESTDPVVVVTLEASELARARALYPGYLVRDTALYARWFAEATAPSA